MKLRKDFVGRMRTTLAKRRDALQRLLAIGEQELRTLPAAVGDIVDAAMDAEYLEVESELAMVESRELANIENALQRIATRQYGTCELCKRVISHARLNALPYANQCIQCQRAREAKPQSRLPELNRRRPCDSPVEDDLRTAMATDLRMS